MHAFFVPRIRIQVLIFRSAFAFQGIALWMGSVPRTFPHVGPMRNILPPKINVFVSSGISDWLEAV